MPLHLEVVLVREPLNAHAFGLLVASDQLVHESKSELSSVDQVAALHDRHLGMGVLRRPDREFPTYITVELWHPTPLIAAIPERHPLAACEQIHIGELRNQPIISCLRTLAPAPPCPAPAAMPCRTWPLRPSPPAR